ncbi:MAG TPA: tyrosine-type recombinase/integrase [Micromonosporaceae bacterium]|nr:tyrosine-type recombinase/integrase [Micromonosporaceae bacterium]
MSPSVLARHLSDYLAMRRALGFKLQRPGALMAQFVDYLDDTGTTVITIDAALAWATMPEGASPSWWSSRLAAARLFAKYMLTIDSATQVPPADLLASPRPRATPFIYSPSDITALMHAAGNSSSVPLIAATYRTLVGLLAVTGLRVGEAVNLDRDDVDLRERVLVVRQAKFGKSRELVLHPSTVTALKDYAALRDRVHPWTFTRAWFISSSGSRLVYKNVHQRFHRLTQAAGLVPRSATCRPRIHDLRHTFAVTTLLGWYRRGVDVQARLPLLSTYLGHVDPGGTYWYLTATPELMQVLAQRLDQAGRPS